LNRVPSGCSTGVKFFEENKRSVFNWGLTPSSLLRKFYCLPYEMPAQSISDNMIY